MLFDPGECVLKHLIKLIALKTIISQLNGLSLFTFTFFFVSFSFRELLIQNFGIRRDRRQQQALYSF